MTAIHLLLVIITILAVLYSDEQGLLWLMGKRELLDAKRVELLHIIVSIGLAGVLLTGGLLFIDRAFVLLTEPAFLVKMVFVLALVINGFFIGVISEVATHTPFKMLSKKRRAQMLLSGFISGAGWTGAAICGLLLTN